MRACDACARMSRQPYSTTSRRTRPKLARVVDGGSRGRATTTCHAAAALVPRHSLAVAPHHTLRAAEGSARLHLDLPSFVEQPASRSTACAAQTLGSAMTVRLAAPLGALLLELGQSRPRKRRRRHPRAAAPSTSAQRRKRAERARLCRCASARRRAGEGTQPVSSYSERKTVDTQMSPRARRSPQHRARRI